MTMNFNKQPYFDDFDEKKNFVRVLFKPSKPVQARELNQIQSIQHHQLQRFADHVFKHGAKVNGSSPTRLNAHYVTIDPVSPWDNKPIDYNKLIDKRLRGQTSQIEAVLLKHVPATDDDPDTLYVAYTLTGADQETHIFLNGEVIDVVDDNDIVTYSVKVRCPTCPNSNDSYPNLSPTGKGTLWNIPESTYYVYGYFIDIDHELLVAEKYTANKESYVVGLDVVVDIVTAEDDPSLYDNALGYPNYSADGADRARVRLIPAVRSENFSDGENFITLVRVTKGVVQYVRSRTDYAALLDLLAERTYDESGNYTVVPFRVKFFEHLKKTPDDPNGYFTKEEGGDENLFVGIVSDGKAYIRGYLVERIAESMIFLEKARDTRKVRNYYNRIGSLNYVLVTLAPNSAFSPDASTGSSIFTNQTVDLYDGPVSGGLPTGSVIGKIKVYDVEYDSTVSGVDRYRLYFASITMNPNKTYDMVKSLYYTGLVTFIATTVNDDATGKPKIYNTNASTLIWDIGRSHIKSLHDVDNPTISSLNYTTRKKFKATLNSFGQYTWNAGSGEFFDLANPIYTLCGVVESNGSFTKIPLSNITITQTTITVNASSHAGKQVILYHNVLKNNVTEKTKTLITTTESDLQITSSGTITLSKADLFKIISIKKYPVANPANKTDVTEHFTWTMGQNDFAYIPIVLTKKPTAPNWSGTDRFEVTFSYYEHGPGDFFSVDSYRNIVDDPNLDYGYEDIPYYKSTSGLIYDMRSCLDFRPLILDSSTVDIKQPALNSLYNTDVEYYLPRTDSIVVNKNGDVYQKKGVSSESPSPPRIETGNEMAIYHVIMKPFVYDIKKDISLRFIENKRYTMRDIGRLEERISNIEYYTTFTMLEMQTAELKIKDENGFDRFKNGFVADNFVNYQAANLESSEFRASLDRKRTELRPSYTMFHTGFDVDTTSTTNAKILGNVVMIDYDSEFWHAQPYASKHISTNPYLVYEKKGKMVLSPDHDTWGDVHREPNLVVNVDTGIDVIQRIANKAGVIGIEWGAWTAVNSTVSSSSSQQTWSSSTSRDWTNTSVDYWFNPNLGWHENAPGVWGHTVTTTTGRDTTTVGGIETTTTTTTVTDWQRSGIKTTFDTRTTSYNLGDRVTDISIIPYMRSRDIEFHATGMKPNTRLYAFFDGVDVTAYCRPLTTGSTFGTPIIVDSNGNVSGVFRIPPGRFFNGQKTFRLTNDPKDSRDPDLLMTSAEAVYWAGGLDISKQATTMNVITPMLIDTTVHDSMQTVNTVTSTVKTQTWENTTTQILGVTSQEFWDWDPLAQTFWADESCFITGVDLWFHSVYKSDRIVVQIKNTENGYPGKTLLGQAFLDWSQINADERGRTSTRVTFPYPIFIEGGKEYALIVGSTSPETRVWISVLGQEDVTRPGFIIDKQPSLGTLFKSQNSSTWTASQYEDLKYVMYRARFKHDQMNLVLKNKPLYDEEIVTDPFETEAGSHRVRVHCKNHGIVVGDKVSFHIGEFTRLNVTASSGQLVIGQKITTSTGSAIIRSVKAAQNNTVDCELTNIKGYFLQGQTFTAQSIVPNLNNAYLVTNFMGHPVTLGPSNVVTGFINQDFNIDINGIPLAELNDELTVIEVDSVDSFIVQTTTPANLTGFAGGDVILDVNRRYEMFNVSGSFTAHGTEYEWRLAGIGHACNGLFESDDYVRQEPKLFVPGQDTHVGKPLKFASRLNEIRRLAGDSSIKVTCNFKTSNKLLSPVVNVESFSLIGVANRVGFADPAVMAVSPNATSQFSPETDPVNGSEVFKYVTRNAVLRNPALDAKILVDVYKPQDTDFDIYIKILHPWENIDIDTKNWTLIEGVWKDFISNSLLDYREVEFTLSELMPNVFGTKEFSTFKVKIVGRSKNPANPPMFKRFRIIAIT
jgi:hypothetical protein